MCDVDCVKLINLVAKRHALWDNRDLNYHNRQFCKKLWDEISLELECSSVSAKLKWQELRELFRKEANKLENGEEKSSWKYFDHLTFLINAVKITKDDPKEDTKKIEEAQADGKLDCIKLINLVAKRPAIWDNKDLNYHNRNCCRKLWLEISQELGCTTHRAKIKWQNLRSLFRKETSKLEYEVDKPTWKYYDHLRFLNNSLKKPVDDPDFVETTYVKVEKYDFDTQLSAEATESAVEKCQIYDSQPDIIPAKQPRLDPLHSSLMSNDEDEDYCFLMSLLPYLRGVPRKRKLAARQALQQVLMNEETEPNGS